MALQNNGLGLNCAKSAMTLSINVFLMTYLSLIFVWFLYALRMSTHTKNKREYTTIKLWLRTNCARYRHLTSLKLA